MKARLIDVAAVLLIGDGVVAAVLPHRHVALWRVGPEPWRKAVAPFMEHPGVTRAAGAAEVVLGLVVAARLPSRS